jgi:hypothetical protein
MFTDGGESAARFAGTADAKEMRASSGVTHLLPTSRGKTSSTVGLAAVRQVFSEADSFMRLRTPATLLLALLLAASPATAQETRGSIEGVVKDSSGAVLPGAMVEARGEAGASTAVTDGQGVFRFPALAPGAYVVTSTLSGFTPARSETILLSLGQVLTVDLAMPPAAVTEEVSVRAESPLIDVKQSAAFANIGRELIDRVPKGRDFTTVVTLAPGANNETRVGGLSIDGASGSENRYFIDGVDTTNLRTGVSGKNLLTDFVEEVQVKSSGYAAEFGGSTGGVINVITRSGANQFRGQIGSYWTGDAVCCDERPSLRLVLTGQNAAEQVTYDEDAYSRTEPFAQIGGPLVHDRVWFFAGYAPQIDRTGRTVTFRTTGQAGTYVSKERTHYASGNLTAQMSRGLRGRFAVNYGEYAQDGRLPAKDGTSNPLTNFAALGQSQPNLGTNATFDYVANSTLFLNARASYLSYDTRDRGVPADPWITFSGSNGIFPGATNVQPNGYNSLLTNMASVKDLYQRMAFSADATYYGTFAGQHTIKGGLQFERIHNDVFNGEQAPHITFYWNASRPTLDGRTVRGDYGYYSYRQIGTMGNVHANNVGLFVQDAWTVTRKLTLNLGLRTERETVPSYVDGLDGIDFGFGDKLAPRAGFAYDVAGDGDWKLYGSWGIFYDVMKLELPRGAFGGDQWIEHYYTLDTLDYLSVGSGGRYPGTFIEDVSYLVPSNDPSCATCGAIDPDLKPMRQQEAVVGLEHALASTVSVSARYVHKQLDRGVEDVGVLVPGVGEIFYIANPGEGVARHILGDEFPSLPKVKRDYDALELRATRRLANRWGGSASYTLSRLYGNYSGLASSDAVGRTSPNVNRFFDSIIMAFGSDAQPVYGRLNTDRPHQLKLNGFYELPTGTSLGAVYSTASGIPISRMTNMQSTTPVFFAGRLTDGRTPVVSQTDLQVLQDVPVGGRTKLQLAVNVLNLFDQDAVTDVFRNLTRDNVPISNSAFFAGFDIDQVLAANPKIRLDPRFLQPTAYQPARSLRVMAKLTF